MNINELNEVLENNVIEFYDNDLVDLAQVGSASTEKQEIFWVKCRFKKSGISYVFTADDFMNGLNNVCSALIDANNESPGEITKSILDELHTKQEIDNSQINESKLSEADVAKKISTSFSIHKDIVVTPEIAIDSDAVQSHFNEFVESIKMIMPNDPVPASVENDFVKKFTACYDAQFSQFDDKTTTHVIVSCGQFLTVLYTDHRIIPATGEELWKKGIEPICFFGRKCSAVASNAEDYDRPAVALAGFDEIMMPANDEADDLEIENPSDMPNDVPTSKDDVDGDKQSKQ